MPRLAFFTLAILREGYGHPRVKGSFDRVAANFAAAERGSFARESAAARPGRSRSGATSSRCSVVADGHTPDWHEATVRLEHLHDHGPTAFAFHFKQAFGPDGHPVELDRSRVKALVRKNAGTPPV